MDIATRPTKRNGETMGPVARPTATVIARHLRTLRGMIGRLDRAASDFDDLAAAATERQDTDAARAAWRAAETLWRISSDLRRLTFEPDDEVLLRVFGVLGAPRALTDGTDRRRIPAAHAPAPRRRHPR